ncbi:MAG: endonuclease [Bacilli bacterium]|nr:endonuclease [Bacilli bacterium]
MKFRKLFMLLLVLVTFSGLAGCDMGGSGADVIKVVSFEKDNDTFVDSAILNQFDIRDWYIRVIYSDDSTDLVAVTYSMLSQADIAKLNQVGTHELTFTFKNMTLVHELVITEPSGEEIENLFTAAMRDDLIASTATDYFVLPQTYRDINISWESQSEYIKIQGTRALVTRPAAGSSDEVAVLVAKFTLYSETREREYHINIPAQGKEEIFNHIDEVAKSINVPSTASNELSLLFVKDEVTINWTSSNTNVIFIDNDLQKVVVNPVMNDTNVTLTYTLTYKGETVSDYEPIVIKVIPVHVVTKAPNPSNLKVNNGTLTWNAISGISKYNVYSNGKLLATISTNSINLKNYISTAGTYTIGVQAIASGSYNTDSDTTTISYTVATSTISYNGNYYNSFNFSVTGSTLKANLRALLKNTHKSVRSYDNMKTDIPKTDAIIGNSSKVLEFYARVPLQGAWSSGGTIWNREHVWPQSQGWFKTSGAGSDLHHIRPTDPTLNSTRGNKPFGEVSNGTLAKMSSGQNSNCYYNSSYFEPQDSAKGDCARIIFYLLTRYSESDSYRITNVAQSYEMLLEWNELDPVDEWEMNRNNVTESIQGNRNPFIDYPSLANDIWG